jgi:hypothetical protein
MFKKQFINDRQKVSSLLLLPSNLKITYNNNMQNKTVKLIQLPPPVIKKEIKPAPPKEEKKEIPLESISITVNSNTTISEIKNNSVQNPNTKNNTSIDIKQKIINNIPTTINNIIANDILKTNNINISSLQKLNTHSYDGKLIELAKYIINNFEAVLSFDDTIKEMILSINNTNYKKKEDVVKVLNLLNNDRKNNTDNTNKISVEELLPRLWEVIRDNSEKENEYVYEQLADILNGTCPQGRCTRIIQLFEK